MASARPWRVVGRIPEKRQTIRWLRPLAALPFLVRPPPPALAFLHDAAARVEAAMVDVVMVMAAAAMVVGYVHTSTGAGGLCQGR